MRKLLIASHFIEPDWDQTLFADDSELLNSCETLFWWQLCRWQQLFVTAENRNRSIWKTILTLHQLLSVNVYDRHCLFKILHVVNWMTTIHLTKKVNRWNRRPSFFEFSLMSICKHKIQATFALVMSNEQSFFYWFCWFLSDFHRLFDAVQLQ